MSRVALIVLAALLTCDFISSGADAQLRPRARPAGTPPAAATPFAPTISSIDGRPSPAPIMARRVVQIRGAGFGGAPGTITLAVDTRDRSSCNLPGGGLPLVAVSWRDDLIAARTPDVWPNAVGAGCHIVVTIEVPGGSLPIRTVASLFADSGATTVTSSGSASSVDGTAPSVRMTGSPRVPSQPIRPVVGRRVVVNLPNRDAVIDASENLKTDAIAALKDSHRGAPSALVLQSTAPGLHGVLGAGKAIIFTPGGSYTFVGHGFANRGGQVQLLNRNLPRGHLDFVITAWSDDKVVASLADDISGIPDLPILTTQAEANGSYTSTQTDAPVTLQLITDAGQTYTLPRRVSFFARRTSVVFGDRSAVPTYDGSGLDRGWAIEFGSDLLTAASEVRRSKIGERLDCHPPGSDRIAVRLNRGWTVVGWSVTPLTPLQGTTADWGGTSFFGPLYDIASANPTAVVVNPGVWREHRSPTLTSPSQDQCISHYAIGFEAVGPIGTAPF